MRSQKRVSGNEPLERREKFQGRARTREEKKMRHVFPCSITANQKTSLGLVTMSAARYICFHHYYLLHSPGHQRWAKGGKKPCYWRSILYVKKKNSEFHFLPVFIEP